MRSTARSFARRAGWLAVTVVLGTAFLAACDEDRAAEPVAPAAPAMPPNRSLYLAVSTGGLGWNVIDSAKKYLLPGAKFQVTGGPYQLKRTFADNEYPDTDLAVGRFALARLATGSYEVCEIVAPAGYQLPNPRCKAANVLQNTIVNLDPFANPTLPFVSMWYKPSVDKAFVGGGSVSIKDTLGNTLKTVVDDGPLDVNKAPGQFKIAVSPAGWYVLCELAPPPGWVFPSLPWPPPICVSFLQKGSGTVNLGPFPVEPVPPPPPPPPDTMMVSHD